MKKLIASLLIASLVIAPVVAAPAGGAGEGSDVQVAELPPGAEEAIEGAIRFLAATQSPDGSWTNGKYPTAITSLSLMAFMLKGHFPKKGPYGEKLDKALEFLIARAKAGGGYMGVSMYEHALATLALSEVWGMSQREEVRDTLKRAVDIILRSQSPRGGWRYKPEPIDADISVTVMQIVALASAKEAGIHVPAHVIRRALAYVKSLQVKLEGGFGYVGPQQPGFARSAAGVMSLLMCGERNSREVQMGLAYLKRLPESIFTRVEHFHYGHYYAIQAMYQAGEEHYQDWYPRIADSLIKQQNKATGAWTGQEGPQYATAMSVLILGVPYRFLPIYQR